jgi:hypothetical protein
MAGDTTNATPIQMGAKYVSDPDRHEETSAGSNARIAPTARAIPPLPALRPVTAAAPMGAMSA